ncbi:MAG: bifunctional methylenetetrahydrofolate dehydrogenase/methenyltetrahydrofolate cyclohydrolase [Dehalococcoidia bacterium]
MLVTPAAVAQRFRREIGHEIRSLGHELTIVGFLAGDSGPSRTYADYTRDACRELGIGFDLRCVSRLDLEGAVAEANRDPDVHGIMVYYPVFDNEQDHYIKDLIDHRKDIEGLSSFWLRKLYENERTVERPRAAGKAIVPCTPLAIVKILEANGAYGASGSLAAEGKTAAVFGRSEVVGRPLAVMMSNDGARVYSFDVDDVLLYEHGRAFETDVTRAEALRQSDLVITGVPSKSFDRIRFEELAPHAVCLNFATIRNFEREAEEKAALFIPRVGPVTVAMCIRNALRLYRTYCED